MKCRSCGTSFENRSHVCTNCGKKRKQFKLIPILMLVALLCMSAFGFILVQYLNPSDFTKSTKTTAVVDSSVIDDHVTVEKETEKEEPDKSIVTKPAVTKSVEKPASEISENVQNDVSQVIDESLKKVVTIYTGTSQGSGFLINDKGDVLTNAHVVEGFKEVTALDSTNQKFSGSVIGYSNNTDVAIVRVDELAGKTSLALETSTDASIGEEVIALGSPLGVRNTATLGYITGVNRSFIVGERSYDNVYQMSAHLAGGSSGGPLLSLKTGKVVAINSARLVEDDSVGFSIPIKSIYSLISDWIASPLSEEVLNSLFYKDNGNMYYQEETENEDDVYFDGGDYSDEDSSYYEIPDDWYNTEENDDEEEEYLEEEPIDESFSDEEYNDSDDDTNESSDSELNDENDNAQNNVEEEISDDDELDRGLEENY